MGVPNALELLHIRKAFGPLVALDDVSLRLAPATVHGLLGENGAGKSTLMSVAYGLLRPDAGRVLVPPAAPPSDSALGTEHSALSIRSPADAIRAGVGMVHQHFLLAGALSVLDNVLLGDRRLPRVLDRRRAAGRLADLARAVGLEVDPAARADTLSVGRQQRVEILKALWRDVRVLILDEPTAVLTPPETDQLFGAVDRLRAQGRAVVFISHKLAEVKRLCDRLTVLRRGRVVWEGPAEGVSAGEIARLMVGDSGSRWGAGEMGRWGAGQRPGADAPSPHPDDRTSASAPTPHHPTSPSPQQHAEPSSIVHPPSSSASPALALRGVTAAGVEDVSLDVWPGEILGVAGVDGNGQQELAELVVGLRRPAGGQVLVGGRDVTRLSPRRRAALGLAHIPNDRKREALVGPMSIAENLALKGHGGRPFSRFGVIAWGRARAVAADLIARFDVRASGPRTPVAALSGGNAQKVVLARELALADPSVVVAMNPARGLDVAATAFVYRQLAERRRAGCAILLISSELDELLELSDRLAVLYRGRLTHTGFPRATREQVARLMAGLDAAPAPAPT